MKLVSPSITLTIAVVKAGSLYAAPLHAGEDATKWEAVGANGELLRPTVVLVRLIYLSIRISRTNKIPKAAVSRELQQPYYDLYAAIATHPEIRGVLTRMHDPDYQLNAPKEVEQIGAFCLMLSGTWLSAGSVYEQRQIDSRAEIEAKHKGAATHIIDLGGRAPLNRDDLDAALPGNPVIVGHVWMLFAAAGDLTRDRRATMIHAPFTRKDQLDKYVEYRITPLEGLEAMTIKDIGVVETIKEGVSIYRRGE